MERIIESGPSPEVHIERVGGGLVLRGWGEDTIQIRAESDCSVEVSRSTQPAAPMPSPDADRAPEGQSDASPSAAQAAEADDAANDSQSNESQPNGGQTHTVVRLRCPSDLVISIPYGARVSLGKVGGECSIKDVGDLIRAAQIGGDCRILNSGAVELSQIGGDCLIQNADGTVNVDTVGGDLRLQDTGRLGVIRVGGDAVIQRVRGSASLGQVGGDTRARGIGGNLTVETRGDLNAVDIKGNIQAQVSGSARLAVAPVEGQATHVNARGSIHCRIPTETQAQVEMQSRGGLHVRNFPLTLDDHTTANFVLGAENPQAATIHLEAHDGITLEGVSVGATHEGESAWHDDAEFNFGDRFEDLAENITRQLEDRLEQLSRHLEERFSNTDDLAARIQDKVQRAMRQAESKIAKALEKAESRTRRAEEEMARREARRNRGGGGRTGSHTYTYITPPTPPTPPVPPRSPKQNAVSEEERMRILRMVENGTISVEQAEKLLAALTK